MDTLTLSVVYALGRQDAFAKFGAPALAKAIKRVVAKPPPIPPAKKISLKKMTPEGGLMSSLPHKVPKKAKLPGVTPSTAPANVDSASAPRGAQGAGNAFAKLSREEGIQDALAKYALAPMAPEGKSFPVPDGDPYANKRRLDPRALANMKNLPYLLAAGGLGAGMWDTVHGRGLGGSMGTAIGTGGGGLLGSMAGKALGARYKLPEGISQLAGAGAGGLLGRALTREERPNMPTYPQGPYGY